MLALTLIYLLLFISPPSNAITTRESKARKGNFFMHQLHSGTLFNTTVPVKWSATLKDRPALPQWLHLRESRHSALAYLIGTPVTTARQITVHVIAKRTDTFHSEQQYIIITLNDDDRFQKSTQQLIDIHVKNFDAESLITDRNGMIGRLEQAASNTFRGKNVLPYIFDVKPEIPSDKEHLFRNQKMGYDLFLKISTSPSTANKVKFNKIIGSIVSIGTQRGFYSNVDSMVTSLRANPGFCRKNNQIPINKNFAPTFTIDWCQTRLHNITSLHDVIERDLPVKMHVKEPVVVDSLKLEATPDHPPREMSLNEDGYSFWQSVLLFPTLACGCIILVLILSWIFFGKREGQQWRDYKTPKQQLEEYVSVRESQRHLRELSVQRQLLLMSHDRDQSVAPSGIHSFLQPKSRAMTSMSGSTRFSKSHSRLNDTNGTSGEETMELLPTSESVPVGKQTVAEAAKQCGSSLHLYRNPLETESEEDNDSDSLEEKHTSGL